jgi:hypothetical protein
VLLRFTFGTVRRSVAVRLVALAIAVGLAAGCSSAATQQPNEQAHRALAAGTPGRPLMLSCTERSNAGVVAPGPGDVVVGPLFIINAKQTVDPNGAGSAPQHGYKYPIAVAPGATVTMMIAASARGNVVIGNPYGPPAGVVAATYRACQPGQEQGWTVFVQGFTFTDGRTRGCVPLTVRIGREARIRHVTVSLYAGPCAS